MNKSSAMVMVSNYWECVTNDITYRVTYQHSLGLRIRGSGRDTRYKPYSLRDISHCKRRCLTFLMYVFHVSYGKDKPLDYFQDITRHISEYFIFLLTYLMVFYCHSYSFCAPLCFQFTQYTSDNMYYKMIINYIADIYTRQLLIKIIIIYRSGI